MHNVLYLHVFVQEYMYIVLIFDISKCLTIYQKKACVYTPMEINRHLMVEFNIKLTEHSIGPHKMVTITGEKRLVVLTR